jgi:hypothetical protein
MPDLIYVYCVMDRMPVLEHLVVSELPDLLVHDGLYAVVGRVPAEDFSEENLPVRLNDLKWITRRVTLHERVVEHAMQYGCVVPLKFGTVFKSEENAHAMLEANATEFRQKLSELAGKEEWGVKVYCDRRQLAASVAAQEPALTELDREIASAPKGRAFLMARRRQELTAAVVNREVARLGQECFERLLEQCLKARANDRLKPEVTGRSEEMILNGAFLVWKDDTPGFLRTVDRLGAQFGPRGLVFEHTGPWPPYNFCEFNGKSAQLG